MKPIEIKLIELAKQYAKFGTEIKLPQTHTNIGCTKQKPWRETGRQIRVYFSDNYKVWAVYFGSHPNQVEIVGYSGMISKSWNIKNKELTAIYEDAKTYLESITVEMIEVSKQNAKKQLSDQIEKLEKELETLKQQ